MARLTPCLNSDVIGLGDFIEYASSNVDCRDPDSVAAAAPMLRSLANDRRLLLAPLHQQMREQFSHRKTPSTQVVVLGGGQDFYVRVDLWPAASHARSQLFAEQFGLYAIGTGQSFPTLMTGYFGPGLIHDLYAYEPLAIKGMPGERVPLTFVERVTLSTQVAALFLPHGEVIQRVAPQSFSASLSLMIHHETGDMHLVDVASQTLCDYPPQISSSRRAAMLRLAGLIGDANTQQYLEDISAAHFCPRTRQAAREAMEALASAPPENLWKPVSSNSDPGAEHQALQEPGSPEAE